LRILNCGDEEGWKRSVGSIVRKNITKGKGGKEYPKYNKTKEGYLDWSHLA